MKRALAWTALLMVVAFVAAAVWRARHPPDQLKPFPESLAEESRIHQQESLAEESRIHQQESLAEESRIHQQELREAVAAFPAETPSERQAGCGPARKVAAVADLRALIPPGFFESLRPKNWKKPEFQEFRPKPKYRSSRRSSRVSSPQRMILSVI